MTLPIPMVRAAAEPPPARQGNEPIASTGHEGEFGKALANAVHDASNATGDGARTRRTRSARSNANTNESQSASSAGSSAVSSETHALPQVELTVGATDPTLQPTARELTVDAGMSFIDALATWQGASGDVTTSSPGDAESDDVASEGTDAAEGSGAGAGALADRFVASSLEAAIAPLAPLALVPAPAGTAATPGTSPVPSERTTAASPSPLALTERAVRTDDDARLAGIAAAMAKNPRAVRREVEALVPEMRQRLDRVIDRMEQEYGYTVEVVETVRTQERQDALYAQGRTQPGPVVTWTRNSRHLDGAAADVVIDGGYDNAAGFERLARVAREEGLRTLWPRDPGHIELTPNAAASATKPARVARTAEGDAVILPAATAEAPTPAIPRPARAGIDPAALRREAEAALIAGDGMSLPAPAGETHILPFPTAGIPRLGEEGEGRALPLRGKGPLGAMPSGATPVVARGSAGKDAAAAIPLIAPAPHAAPASEGVAHVAAVAQVAQVAPVAQVARVAEVATVGDVRAQGGPAAAPTTVVAGPTLARESQTRGSGRGDRQSSGERGEGERSDALASAMLSRDGKEASRVPFVREIVAREGSESSSSAPVAGLSRSDATERIARVLRIQESGGDRPLSSVLLRLESPDGGEDRIRIDLRGRSVGATLDVADPRAAEQLRLHVTELQDALQRQGLEGEAMVVRTTQRSMDASTLTATAVAAERDVLRTASASASDGGGSTAKDSRNQSRAPFEREFEREGTDQQRSRQRRDGKGESR